MWSVGAFLLAFFFLIASSCAVEEERSQRIVVITVDTLRFDGISSNEQPLPMQLTRSRFEECASFDRFFSSTSTTQPTHATLFTELHPWQHGVTRNSVRLGDENVTLAEILRDNGFKTAAVVASVPVSRVFGFDQGFDFFEDDFTHVQLPGAKGVAGERYYSLADSVTETAISLLDDLSDFGKQFLWVHYFDPHAPYGDSGDGPTIRPMPLVKMIVDGKLVREPAIREARRLYELDTRFMDRQIRHLFQRLDRDRDRVETHIVFTSDHGESFGEDDSMAHGRRLTLPQIHVPFYICSSVMEPGNYNAVAGSIDFTPTVLSIAGLPAAANQGRDLTQPEVRGRVVVGMKTTQHYQELRLDGETYDLSHDLFYAVDENGVIYRGTSESIMSPGARPNQAGSESLRPIQDLFASFDEQLKRTDGELLTSPEIVNALRTLGYAIE